MSFVRDNVICTRNTKMQLTKSASHEVFNNNHAKLKATINSVLSTFEQHSKRFLIKTIGNG